MYVSHWPSFRRPLLTRSTGNASDQYLVGYQDLGSQYEAPQPIPIQYSPVLELYVEPYWFPAQPYLSSGGYDFPPGIGGNVGPVVATGYDETSRSWPRSEDPGCFSRCGIDPGAPIHLTTNIRMVLPHVSYLCLFEEVCRYSIWRVHWY